MLTIGDHEYDLDNDVVVLTKRMTHFELKKNNLWSCWMKEYFLHLREYHKINKRLNEAPKIGQLVLVIDN